jgi:hypothetical protein
MAVKSHSITETPAPSIFIEIVTIYSHWLSTATGIAFLLNS